MKSITTDNLYLIILACGFFQFALTMHFWVKWRKWENAYWQIRNHYVRNEDTKKTVVMELFHAPKSTRVWR